MPANAPPRRRRRGATATAAAAATATAAHEPTAPFHPVLQAAKPKKPSIGNTLSGVFDNITPATKMYMFACMAMAAVSLVGVPDELLLFEPVRTFAKGQFWRPFTSACFLGKVDMSMASNLYFLYKYGQEMERQDGPAQHAIFILSQVRPCLPPLCGDMGGAAPTAPHARPLPLPLSHLRRSLSLSLSPSFSPSLPLSNFFSLSTTLPHSGARLVQIFLLCGVATLVGAPQFSRSLITATIYCCSRRQPMVPMEVQFGIKVS